MTTRPDQTGPAAISPRELPAAHRPDESRPFEVRAYKPNQSRPSSIRRANTRQDAIQLADAMSQSVKFAKVVVSQDHALIYTAKDPDSDLPTQITKLTMKANSTPSTPSSKQTPTPTINPVTPHSEWRSRGLHAQQPLIDTPEDVLALTQALAVLDAVELRAIPGPDPQDSTPLWWVIFLHGRPSTAAVRTICAAQAPSLHQFRIDERAVMARPVSPEERHRLEFIGGAKTRQQAAKKEQSGKTPATKSPKSSKSQEPVLCLCGCEGTTKSRFVPGHDARFYSMLAQFQVMETLPNLDTLPEYTQRALAEIALPEKKLYLRDKWLAKKEKDAATPTS